MIQTEKSFGTIPLMFEKSWFVFLVQLKNGSHWGFPKGHPEQDESPQDTAVRELTEETRLSIKRFLSPEPFIETYTFKKEEQTVNKTVHYFLVEVEGTYILQKGEIIDGKWFSFESAKNILTYEQSKKILQQTIHFVDSHDL